MAETNNLNTQTESAIESLADPRKIENRPIIQQADARTQMIQELLEHMREARQKIFEKKGQAHWIRIHAYTCQVLNAILRDKKLEEWERRLQVIEADHQESVPTIDDKDETETNYAESSCTDRHEETCQSPHEETNDEEA